MPSHREILEASRRTRRRKYFRRGVLVLTVTLLALATAFWYLWNSSSFSLSKIVVAGEINNSDKSIITVVDEILSEKYFGLLTKKVNWFYPRVKLKQTLEEKFPELDLVEITNPSFGMLQVEVSFRRPIALWCEVERCYFVDRTGLVYAPAPTFSNTPLLTLSGEPLPLPIGSRPLSISNFQALLDLSSSLDQSLGQSPDFSSQTVNTVSLAEPVDYVFGIRDVRHEDESQTWRLLVARQVSAVSSAERLTAALIHPGFLSEHRLASTTLDFLDVRFERKVFYKFM